MSESTFDAAWLTLREPIDHRSRARDLEKRLSREGEARGFRRVVDLGGGTGSNVRHLAARIPWAVDWCVVDHDADLLGRVRAPAGSRVERVQADLASSGFPWLDDADVVTASALLDLVSQRWLGELAARCASTRTAALLALSVDGTVRWGGPDDPDDDWIRETFNRHQTREKGLGAALGPRAAQVARDAFDEAGFATWLRPSPWVLRDRPDAALALALLEGWASAAIEMRPERRDDITEWAGRRRRLIVAGEYELEVGHLDLLALPQDGRT